MSRREWQWGCWCLRQLQPVLTLAYESPLPGAGPKAGQHLAKVRAVRECCQTIGCSQLDLTFPCRFELDMHIHSCSQRRGMERLADIVDRAHF